ncbi:M23/M56 family metallopeptidase [Maricaulis sp.]|uniref:M23/M56 family metallopeptidase n=1 Tax=Maricaulis sp. TaxID=1486257 RepID=UPI00260EF547|nr:M23/M56 family metallopeptidase [Maricaulis sp.]
MSGLVQAIVLGVTVSVLAGLVLLLAARVFERHFAPLTDEVWRAFRILTLLPVVAAPVIHFVPQTREVAVPQYEIGTPVEFHSLHVDSAEPVEPAPAGLAWPSASALMSILGAIYGLGLGLALIGCWHRHCTRQRLLAEARPGSPQIDAVLRGAAHLSGTRMPELLVREDVDSPVLTGWREIILAPAALAEAPQTARFALLHELVHLRRGDERDRLIGTALKTVFWFHWPLRQLEFHLDAAREMACDAEVLEILGSGARKPYAASLIGLMQAASAPASAFGADNRRLREMRIKAILNRRPRSARSASLIVLAASAVLSPVALAQTLMTDRVEQQVPVYVQPLPSVAPLAEPTPEPTPEPAVGPIADLSALPAVAPLGEPVHRATSDPRPVVRAEPVAEPSPAPQVEPGLTAPSGEVVLAMAPSADRLPRVIASAPAGAGLTASTPRFSHTVTDGRITSLYGDRPARPAGAPRMHHGVDVAAPLGTAINAPGAGVVTHADMGYGGSQRWGNTVVIDHGEGWSTLYAHMHTINVEVGEVVQAGSRIGRVGSTGASTGPHVHVELRYNGERVDPGEHIPGLPARNQLQ